ncbi:MAG: nucleotidyltransferase family protein [Methanocorpusculum sp.]|nr:nucleotidyltransferase family protein [Methanocorpusculum sp.]
METEYVSIKDDVLKKLEANLPEIRERFGIETIGIFGSVSRGEDTTESDVDVMISFMPLQASYRNLLGLNHFLTDLFNRRVDLVTVNGISPYIKPYVETDIIWKTTT